MLTLSDWIKTTSVSASETVFELQQYFVELHATSIDYRRQEKHFHQ